MAKTTNDIVIHDSFEIIAAKRMKLPEFSRVVVDALVRSQNDIDIARKLATEELESVMDLTVTQFNKSFQPHGSKLADMQALIAATAEKILGEHRELPKFKGTTEMRDVVVAMFESKQARENSASIGLGELCNSHLLVVPGTEYSKVQFRSAALKAVRKLIGLNYEAAVKVAGITNGAMFEMTVSELRKEFGKRMQVFFSTDDVFGMFEELADSQNVQLSEVVKLKRTMTIRELLDTIYNNI